MRIAGLFLRAVRAATTAPLFVLLADVTTIFDPEAQRFGPRHRRPAGPSLLKRLP